MARKPKTETIVAPPVSPGTSMVLAGLREKVKACNLVQLDKVEMVNPFLDYAYLSNNKTPNMQPWHLVLVSKGVHSMVLQPYTVSHIATRRAVRRLQGSEYVDRMREPVSPNPAWDDAVAKAEKKENGWRVGLVHLFVLLGKEELTIATIECFDAGENYWTECFKAASLGEHRCADVQIVDHTPNLKQSKAGYDYLASWKFTQFKGRELTPVEADRVREYYATNAERVQGFFE